MRKLAVAAAALALLAAGCGGAQRTPQTLSLRAFLVAADRICADATTRGGRLARLRALHPPASAAGLYAYWLRAEEDALVAAASRGKPSKEAGLAPAVMLAIAEGKVVGYARRLGAETCAMRTIGTMPR
jgi:hypothetical protein